MIQNLGPDKIAFKWTKYKKTEQKGYATFQSNQFSLADSVWAISVWAVSVTGLFSLGRSGLETFRSGYEILQKSCMFTFQRKHT